MQNTTRVEIVVNGEARAIQPGQTILDLIQILGLDPSRLAVELDRRIVRRPEWDSVPLKAGSNLEIVQFVGGG